MTITRLPEGRWVPVPDDPDIPAALRAEGAYLPHPLPSELWLPPDTYRTVAEAEHQLGRVDEAADRLAVRAGLACATRLRDACGSAALAGNFVGFRAALREELLARHGESPIDPAVRALVRPYIGAQEHGIGQIAAGRPLDAGLIAEISAIMTGAEAAELRGDYGWLGRDLADAYLLTAGGAHLAGSIEQWSTWVTHENAQPQLAKIAIGHAQLEMLQPFPTANGYVARSYTSLALVQSKLVKDQIVPLSTWLDDHVHRYGQEIRAVVDTREIHPWVAFFARGIGEQARAQLALITALEDLRRDLLDRVPRTGHAPEVVRELIGFPAINHAVLCKRYGVTEKGATLITRQLEDAEIVDNSGDRAYRRVYLCEPVVRLMTLDPGTRSDPEPRDG